MSMFRSARRFAALCLAFAAGIAAGEPTIPRDDVLMKGVQGSFPEYLEVLSLPNDAINRADVQKNADWFEAAFRKRGFSTKQLPNDGKPLVFAEYGRSVPGAKTILFYMHLDGQPVLPEQWAQKSPWTA